MPGMVRTGLLRTLQQSHWMPDAWTLVHPTGTNGAQGRVQVWAVTASGSGDTGARFSPLKVQAREDVQASQLTTVSGWTIQLPYGTTVAASDRILKGVALTAGAAVTWPVSARTFEVKGVTDGQTGAAAVAVTAEEVGRGGTSG